MAAIGGDLRRDDVFDLIEAGIVEGGRGLPRLCPAGGMRQLRRQDGRLQPVQAAVDALDLMLVLGQPTVPRQHRHGFGEIGALCHDGAGVAHRPEILAGME